MNALRSKWSTQLAKASLGELGWEASGKSPYSISPAAATMMDSLQSDLAVENQALVSAGYAQAKTQQVDSSLSSVNGLLNNIQVSVLRLADGNMTDSQKQVERMQIDTAVNTINSIGNNSSFLGQKLLDGTPITFNPTGKASDMTSFTPPVVSSATLGSDKGTLSDLAGKLAAGKFEDASSIVQGAQNTVRNGRAVGGSFANEVQDQTYAIVNQIESNTKLYNQTKASIVAQSSYKDSEFTAAISNLNRTNMRAQIGLTLLAGLNQWR
jgi:flagellin-like hook-associated protein FlgL